MTALMFGYAIRACRGSWRRHKFWLLVTVFFTVHSGVGLFALTRVATVPLVLYPMLFSIEYFVLIAYLGFFLDSN
jgi:hypothetical protein